MRNKYFIIQVIQIYKNQILFATHFLNSLLLEPIFIWIPLDSILYVQTA